MIRDLSMDPVSSRLQRSLVTGGMVRLRGILESFSNQRSATHVQEIKIALKHQAKPHQYFMMVAEKSKVGSKGVPFNLYQYFF